MTQRTILSLPTELIDGIVAQIDRSLDRWMFSRTCRKIHGSVATLPLSCIDVEFQHTSSPAEQSFGVLNEQDVRTPSTIAHIDVDGCSFEEKLLHADVLKMSNDRDNLTCSNTSCRACILAEDLRDLDVFLSAHSRELSKRFSSLILRGTLEKRAIPPNVVPGDFEHGYLSGESLATLCLQRFAFNIHWIYWDIEILKKLSFSHLTSLKLPLGLASDSLEVGNALISMTSLRSLTITDMPDRHRFLRLFPILGLGILSRTGSLRELDLSITNYNRPDQYCTTWERIGIEDEPFEAPKSFDYFFKALFPKSDNDVYEEMKHNYLGQKTLVTRKLKENRHTLGPLKLDKLRLKRIDVPEYAFTHIFDGAALTQLRIPDCNVHPAVWSSLSPNRMAALEDINYELLPGTLLAFLRSQPYLKSLCFRRPADQYKSLGRTWYPGDDAPTECFKPWRQASPLGRGTAWGEQCCYSRREKEKLPSLSTLLETLSETKMETLLLPADMYDVTPHIVSTISIQLPFLKELTWGFDYKNIEIRKAFEKGFLSNVPRLRKITFLSLHLPNGWNDLHDEHYVFNAPIFQWYIETLGQDVPAGLRYIRYRHLVSPGECQKTTVFYHRLVPRNGRWWMLLSGDEGEEMFEKELTPQIVPLVR